MNIAEIADGTIVRGRPIRYGEYDHDLDLPDYKAMDIGPVVEGPLSKFPSILGHISCFVDDVAVEEGSIEVVEAMSDIERIVEELTVPPKSLGEAQSPDELPAEPGLYSWWAIRGSIPAVPHYPHPALPDLDLYYLGIAPSGVRSAATIRSRVIGNHIRGNTGASTLRLTLAALLFEDNGWEPVAKGKKTLLKPQDNKDLTHWQHEYLLVCWAVHPEPWSIEHEVIRRLQPPLNLEGNTTHAFAATVSAARKNFKEAATPSDTEAAPRRMNQIRRTAPAKGARMGGVTLHEEIAAILREHGGWMTRQAIADAVNRRGHYQKKDASPVESFQIGRRAYNYGHLFEIDDTKIRLRT